MQIKSEFLGSDKFSQDVSQIFLNSVCINRKLILKAIHNAQLLGQLMFLRDFQNNTFNGKT